MVSNVNGVRLELHQLLPSEKWCNSSLTPFITIHSVSYKMPVELYEKDSKSGIGMP
jgi:hypothetical protein